MLSVPRFLAALPVQGGVGFDVDNLVGLAIVFFAVIWPVIRGLLNVAKSNRQDFQARSKRGVNSSQASSSRSSALEAFLEGLREEDDEETPRVDRAAERALRRSEEREEELRAQQARRERAQLERTQLERTQRERSRQERLRAAPSADPFESAADRQEAAASSREVPEASGSAFDAPSSARASSARASSARASSAMEAVDGFDVSINDELVEVPSEDDLEEGKFGFSAGAGRERSEREPDEEGLEVLEGAGERAAFALDKVKRSPLERVQGGRSPWQSAILMKEILGSPISVSPHNDQLL